jgi:GNAT superfamily N-acetyltransferase
VAGQPTETPTTLHVHLRRLGAPDVPVAADVLAEAFAREPGNLALYPDEDVRGAVLRVGAVTALRSTIRLGTAHGAFVGDDLAALALWHPPGVARSSPPRDALAALTGAGPDVRRLVRGVPRAAANVAATGRDALRVVRARHRAVGRASAGQSWHLAFLGTVPSHRGRGLARALLDRQLERCDQDGLAVWLETTDPVNPPLYERFGFRVTTHVADAAWLPGLWVMRREPRPT